MDRERIEADVRLSRRKAADPYFYSSLLGDHIEELFAALSDRDARIAALEAENERLGKLLERYIVASRAGGEHWHDN